MKVNTTGLSAEFLKRKAKFLKKKLGITHIQSLNLIANEYGFPTWDGLIGQVASKPKQTAVVTKPKMPDPLVRNYYDQRTGAILGQHPNVKMPKRRHVQVGSLLRVLLGALEYHKRAKNVIYDIIAIMDTWLGYEYSPAVMGNEEFNAIYYGKNNIYSEVRPTLRQQEEFKRSLRKAKEIIERYYHHCKPLEKLKERFDLAGKMMEKWPKESSFPKVSRKQIASGTFVRLIGTDQIGVIFNHPYGGESVVGYSDGGIFHRGRHEVSVLRRQPSLNDFNPMRLNLPYGKWICEDGREVLFNRDYTPIWDKSVDNVVANINPDTYVAHEKTNFYYDDATAPYYGNAETLELCLSVLNDWGVAEKKPKVMDLLPAALTSGNARLLSPKGIS